MRRSALLVGVTAAAAVCALTACGPNNVAGSAVGTSGASSAQGASGVGAQINTVDDLANAVGDQVSHKNTVHLQMTANTSAGTMTGTGQANFTQPVSEQLNMTAAGTQMQMVLVNNAFYLQVPQLQQETGKPWIKIDGNGTDPISKAFGSIMKTADQNADPTQMINKLKDSGTLESTTKETVDGQPTTHYKILVDVNKMAQNETDPTTKQLLQQAVQGGLKSYPVDIWLNSDNLPVKMTTNTVLTDPTSGKAISEATTVTFTDWGAPVSIQAPPADQVGSISAAMNGGH